MINVVAQLLYVDDSKISSSDFTDLCDGSNILLTLNAPDQGDSSGNIPELVIGSVVHESIEKTS